MNGWQDNYDRMIRRNRATGFAIYHCLIVAFLEHKRTMFSGITDQDITRISERLLVSERWVRHILCKYRLFWVMLGKYYPEPGWQEKLLDI